jgi:hypothetical protein
MNETTKVKSEFKIPQTEEDRKTCPHRAKNVFRPNPGASEISGGYDLCKKPKVYCPHRYVYGSSNHCISDKEREGKE